MPGQRLLGERPDLLLPRGRMDLLEPRVKPLPCNLRFLGVAPEAVITQRKEATKDEHWTGCQGSSIHHSMQPGSLLKCMSTPQAMEMQRPTLLTPKR